MALHNTPISYGSVTRAFHWSIGLLIIALLIMGLSFDSMPGELRGTLMPIHKATGILVFILAALRVLWWLREVKPVLVDTIPAPLKPLVSYGHTILYAFMVIMPLSGWLMSNAAGYPVSFYGLFTLPPLIDKSTSVRNAMGALHEVAAYTLIVLLIAHIGAALVHHFVFRDATLTRMLTGKKAK